MVERSQDETPEVKVTDRRQFTPEGERKAPESDEPAAAPSPESAAAGAGEDPADASAGRPDFGTLVMGLANTALIHMGELRDPARPQTEPDLAAAREVIDLLGLLQEKTKGNLTAEEEHLLGTLLFKLRMDYTEKAAAR